jgi:hypothetical protein
MHTFVATFNSIIAGTIGATVIQEVRSRPAVFAHEDGPGASWQIKADGLLQRAALGVRSMMQS